MSNLNLKTMSNLNLTELKDQFKRNVTWRSNKPELKGGQHCGMPVYTTTLVSEELSVQITVGYHRSTLKNSELAMTLFELALDELVK